MSGLDRLAVALCGLAVLLLVAAVCLAIAAVWATGETGSDLLATAMILGSVAPFVGIASFALMGRG